MVSYQDANVKYQILLVSQTSSKQQKILTTISILTEAPTSDHTDLLQVNLVQTVLVGVAEGLRFIDPEFINEEERADALPALLQKYFNVEKAMFYKILVIVEYFNALEYD